MNDIVDYVPGKDVAYIVYHQSADSYHSHAELPKAVFLDMDDAIEFATAQKGYGYNVDWFVKPITLYFRED